MSYSPRIEPRMGPIVLFGSGETSPSGRKVFDSILRKMDASPKLALIETPAGFEPNSDRVIGKIADFIRTRLQNYDPQVEAVPARKRGTTFSPDEPQIVASILEADMVFMGPGSPTYAVRQLRDSLAWYYLIARHRLGAALVMASAATVAFSAFALPVYEIYKVGQDLHWAKGLDFFGLYGLPLVFIPHWNNNDGGEELDTSRCYMGRERFAALMSLLPPDLSVLGIDEKTALIMDVQAGTCRVMGQGGVTIIHTGHSHPASQTGLDETDLEAVARIRRAHVHQFKHGETFDLNVISKISIPTDGEDLPPGIWEQAVQAQVQLDVQRQAEPHKPDVPEEIIRLVQARQTARDQQDWAAADALRAQIAALGWQVNDTPDGPVVELAGV